MSELTEEKIIELAAKAMWMTWARVSDPSTADYRWKRMKEWVKAGYIKEATACISTYRYLKGE